MNLIQIATDYRVSEGARQKIPLEFIEATEHVANKS
jgi:hypothetical protein